MYLPTANRACSQVLLRETPEIRVLKGWFCVANFAGFVGAPQPTNGRPKAEPESRYRGLAETSLDHRQCPTLAGGAV